MFECPHCKVLQEIDRTVIAKGTQIVCEKCGTRVEIAVRIV